MCTGCGGGGSSASKKKTSGTTSARIAGVNGSFVARSADLVEIDTTGMTLLRYVGGNLGKKYWQSNARGLQYQFSGRDAKPPLDTNYHRERWVVNEDIEFFMRQREAGKPAFEVVEQGKKAEEPATKEVEEAPAEDAPVTKPRRKTQSQKDYESTQRARRLAARYALDYKDVPGTGINGRVTVPDVQAVIDKIEADATREANDLAEERGLDIRELVHRTKGKIKINHVRDYLQDYEDKLAVIDATVDEILTSEEWDPDDYDIPFAEGEEEDDSDTDSDEEEVAGDDGSAV